jgi:hypothetical protein
MYALHICAEWRRDARLTDKRRVDMAVRNAVEGLNHLRSMGGASRSALSGSEEVTIG